MQLMAFLILCEEERWHEGKRKLSFREASCRYERPVPGERPLPFDWQLGVEAV